MPHPTVNRRRMQSRAGSSFTAETHEALPATPTRLRARGRDRRSAFTMIELLVVMAIIAILAGAVVVGATFVVNKARSRQTESILGVVNMALEEFKREQTANPTLTRARQVGANGLLLYRDRYGLYPPDELEVFTKAGLPGATTGGTLAIGGATVVPGLTSAGTKYEPMTYYIDDPPEARREHRDVVAMVLAITMFGDASRSVLDDLPESNRVPSPRSADDSGKPGRFLDRDGNGTWEPEQDEELWHIKDGWGVPLSYYAQRDWREDPPAGMPNIPSGNHPDWNEASTEFITLNGGRPVIMSYGPNGKDQLKKAVVEKPEQESLLHVDWETNHVIDGIYNKDNVYIDSGLSDRLFEGKSP